MQTYKVRRPCEIAGVWREAGDEIVLSEEQAFELAPPFGSVVDRALVSKGKCNGRSERHKRQDGRGTKRLG